MPIPHYPPKLDDVICHAGDASDIPLRSPSGSGALSYAHGFPPITSLPLEAGGVAPLREDLNAALKLLSSHAHYHQVGAPLVWSPELDYIERCEVYGADGVKYVAQRASGPSIPSTGAKDPAAGDEAFWKRWDLDISKVPHADTAVRGITRLATADETRDGTLDTVAVTPAGLEARLAYRLTEFRSWYEHYPPPGWAIRNGGVLLNAKTHYPALWAALHQPENAWKLKSESEWQAMSAAEPWNGIGGVPYFVLDAEAGTVRLPDTRGMYVEDAGFDGLGVGGVHGDAIRDIYGQFAPGNHVPSASGSFYSLHSKLAEASGYWNGHMIYFAASRVVPVASKNQPRAFGMLPCVYVGGEKQSSCSPGQDRPGAPSGLPVSF